MFCEYMIDGNDINNKISVYCNAIKRITIG